MAEVSPSILAADFARLGDNVREVEQAGAKMLHVDVMDGRFVPNISIGIPVVESLRAATDLILDCHLMIVEPERYVADFAKAGARMISLHQEACPHLNRSIQLIKDHDVVAGVVINPGTPVSTLDEVLGFVDFVLVMSVNPGFGGQKFIPQTLDKVRQLDSIRAERGLDYKIEIDGGVKQSNAREIAEAGCDILVAGSSIFWQPDIGTAFREMSESLSLQRT